jgi:Tfp pilus assembly protein PilP
MFRGASAIALLFTVLAVAGCGKSAEEKARAQVCEARADISKQITTLSGLTLSTSSITQAKSGVEAIAGDLKKIKGAQAGLNPARKQQAEAATNTFEAQLTAIVKNLTSNLSLTNAASQVQSAVTQLTTSYKQTLAPISCP